MKRARPWIGLGAVAVFIFLASSVDASSEVGKFVEVASDDVGGHFFSQVIYAPTVNAVVSWGTRTHSHPIRAHETQHFLVDENNWIDAWPSGKEEIWAGEYRKWGDWSICAPTGFFYERDGVEMPRPNCSFYQLAWDEHKGRIIHYLGSMTFSYQPERREWKLIHDRSVKQQPPALLLWGSLCYEPVNKQVILFGGGGVDAPDGRPHTWALDVTTDGWRKLELEVEPPARCNSRMVYDRENKLIVLFGGDGQDRALADTWVFDVTKQRWEERKPSASPYPRSCQALAYLDKSGLVLLVGGLAVSDWRERERLSNQVWVYDAARNVWTPLAVEIPKMDWASMENIPGTDEVVLVTGTKYNHGRKTYRFRYDGSIPRADYKGVPPGAAAYKTGRSKEWYEDIPPANMKAHLKFLAELEANKWIEVVPPKSTAGRTWGSAIFNVDKGIALKWGGGHSGYQGTDMAFYDVAANRFTIDRTPAFTPEPFGRWARRPAGRTFFNQPWARHMRHTCAYDPVVKLGIFTDAGGSAWYEREKDDVVKHTWLYHPEKRCWLEPIPQPFPGGGTLSPIAVPTPKGVVVVAASRQYQVGSIYRFVGEQGKPESWGWEEIEMVGDARPRQQEHLTVVYDDKRDRLVMLSQRKREEGSEPELWFFNMKERQWVKNPKPAPGGLSTREAVYVPSQDAILAYGPAKKDDPVWTRVYLCGENRWVSLPIETPQYTVHEVALEYDPVHELAVLLWPPAFERDIRPHLFRLDVKKLPRP